MFENVCVCQGICLLFCLVLTKLILPHSKMTYFAKKLSCSLEFISTKGYFVFCHMHYQCFRYIMSSPPQTSFFCH